MPACLKLDEMNLTLGFILLPVKTSEKRRNRKYGEQNLPHLPRYLKKSLRITYKKACFISFLNNALKYMTTAEEKVSDV